MDTTQSQEALQFFRRGARDWKRAATSSQIYNVVRERQRLVLSLLDDSPCRLLDIGCGTGEVVHEAAKRGHSACGIDFSPEMILLARSNAPKGARFIQSSLFDSEIAEGSFDLVTANGFIEYISPGELERFFDLAASALVPGGRLAVHSRNRLFNLVSNNAYTDLEKQLGTLVRLQTEARILAACGKGSTCFDRLEALQSPLPVVRRHPHTGIGVHTRHQYAPSELVRLAKTRGLVPLALYPLHFHAFGPQLKTRYPRFHQAAAKIAQRFLPKRHALLTRSSSFVLVWRKNG